MSLLTLISGILILTGALFTLIGAIGLLRMPDFYTRLHPVGVKDALGLPLILLGIACHTGLTVTTFKLAIIFLFLMFTGPTACHALARAATLEKHPVKKKGKSS